MAILPGDPALYGAAPMAPQAPVAAPAAAPLAVPAPQAPGLFQALAPAALGLLGTAMGGGNSFARGYAGGLNNAARNRRAEYDQQLRRWQIEQAARQSQAQLELSQERLADIREGRKQTAADIQALAGGDPGMASLWRVAPGVAARQMFPETPKPTDLSRKLQDAGYVPGTPEFEAAAQRYLFKPTGTTINMAPTGFAQVQQPDGTTALQPVRGGPADPAYLAERAEATAEAKDATWTNKARKAIGEYKTAWEALKTATTSGDRAAAEAALVTYNAKKAALSSPVLRARAGGADPGDTAVNAFADRAVPGLTGEVMRRALGGEGAIDAFIQSLEGEFGVAPAQPAGAAQPADSSGMTPRAKQLMERMGLD